MSCIVLSCRVVQLMECYVYDDAGYELEYVSSTARVQHIVLCHDDNWDARADKRGGRSIERLPLGGGRYAQDGRRHVITRPSEMRTQSGIAFAKKQPPAIDGFQPGGH